MRVRSQGVARLHHGTTTVQRFRDVLADELRVGFLADGVGHHVRLVVLDVLQERRAVLRAHNVRVQNHQVNIIYCTAERRDLLLTVTDSRACLCVRNSNKSRTTSDPGSRLTVQYYK